MSDQRTLERTLEMMVMLLSPGGRTISGMAEHFDVHPRTIKRTLQSIEDAGFFIRSARGRYYMDKQKKYNKTIADVSEFLAFTREELWMLNCLLEGLPYKKGAKSLGNKLFSLMGTENAMAELFEKSSYLMVKTIEEAIVNKRQIILEEYTHATGGKKYIHVFVEPIQFANDKTRIWVNRDGTNFLLRLETIHGVHRTDLAIQHEATHQVGYIDVFGGSGFETYKIGLVMNHRSMAFFQEDFPSSDVKFKPIGNGRFETWLMVCNYFHVARFCMGLPGDIEILSPELQTYINNKLANSHEFNNKPYFGMV